MSDEHDPELTELGEGASADLEAGLRTCQAIVEDYRARLSSVANDDMGPEVSSASG